MAKIRGAIVVTYYCNSYYKFCHSKVVYLLHDVAGVRQTMSKIRGAIVVTWYCNSHYKFCHSKVVYLLYNV